MLNFSTSQNQLDFSKFTRKVLHTRIPTCKLTSRHDRKCFAWRLLQTSRKLFCHLDIIYCSQWNQYHSDVVDDIEILNLAFEELFVFEKPIQKVLLPPLKTFSSSDFYLFPEYCFNRFPESMFFVPCDIFIFCRNRNWMNYAGILKSLKCAVRKFERMKIMILLD